LTRAKTVSGSSDELIAD